LLTVQNLTKDYGNFRAVDNISFEVLSGSATLLIGPNGAGKTTIVKSILALLQYRGDIIIDGIDVAYDGPRARTKIGYVPQQLIFSYNTSVEEQAYFIGKLKDAPKTEAVDALKRANLWEIRERKVNSLSHGMRQKLGISLALIRDPPLLIFDEPINNVDLKGQLEFRETIQELSKQGKTVFVATHLSGLSEFVSTAIVLHKGKIVAQGTPAELLSKMNAADTLYLRVPGAEAQKVLEMIGTSLGHKVSRSEEWLVFSLPPGMKANVLREILEAGYNVKDLIIEPSTIESRYVKLLGEVSTS
jgi:ABC-2 type transport system ATP-binding protein